MNWTTQRPGNCGGTAWQQTTIGAHTAIVRWARNRWDWKILQAGKDAYVATGWCKTEAAAKAKAEMTLTGIR